MAGLLGNSYDPYGGMSSLLGVDTDAMRKQALWNGLAAAGFTLMGDRNLGRAGGAFLLGTNQARDDYMNAAMDAYKLKSAEEERAYNRQWREEERDYRQGRDAEADQRWQMEWDYNTGRQSKADAWANTERQRQLEDWQRQDDQRQQQQDYVTGWMDQQEQAGVNLLPQNVRDMARAGGVQGMVSPVDEWRYGQAQPYAQAGMYPEAFQQMTAQPQLPEGFTLGKDQTRFDAYGNPIATGGGGTMQPDWKETTLEDGVYWIDQNNPQNRQKIGERPNRNEGEGREFTQEGKLRNEYVKEAKPFTDLRINYQKILASAQDNTGASDIAMVYSFMKMLDPTSVVREGEFATAENAGGVPTQIMTMYNRALTGQRLTPEIRQQFLQQAGRQYEQQGQTYQAIRQQYQNLARQYGIDPERVAPDLAFGVEVRDPSLADIPSEALQELRADPSPEAMQEFDQVFGQGAAARVLGVR